MTAIHVESCLHAATQASAVNPIRLEMLSAAGALELVLQLTLNPSLHCLSYTGISNVGQAAEKLSVNGVQLRQLEDGVGVGKLDELVEELMEELVEELVEALDGVVLLRDADCRVLAEDDDAEDDNELDLEMLVERTDVTKLD